VYEEPEIRAVVPEHLVRCGFTSAYDVKFGLEVGAGAVLLLLQGITGVTVTGLTCGEVRYMRTEDAIKQRYVDLREVALYEQLGFCFGRKPAPFEATFREVSGAIERIYM
jgi:6-phosphofructokinase 1